MGIGRGKAVKTLSEEYLKNIKISLYGYFPDTDDKTTEEKLKLLDSIGIHDIETLDKFFSELQYLTSESNLNNALKIFEATGLSPGFLVELNKRKIFIENRRNRETKSISFEDAKKLYKNKENLDEVDGIISGGLTVPEYYKLKKITEYNKDFVATFKDEFSEEIKNVNTPKGKYDEAVKILRDVNNYGFKIVKENPDYKNLEITFNEMMNMRNPNYRTKTSYIKKVMQKYGASPYLSFWLSEDQLKQFIKYTSNYSNSERDLLYTAYVSSLPVDMVSEDKHDVIVALAKNNISPAFTTTNDDCYGKHIGYIGCKICRRPPNLCRAQKEKVKAITKDFCRDCFYGDYTCKATYKNLFNGKCMLKTTNIPFESSTLRHRF